MSPRAARVAALPFALLAFALRVANAFWLRPLTWRVGSDAVGFLLWGAGTAACAALPLAAYALLTRRARTRPAAFDVDAVARQFVATLTPRLSGSPTVMAGWLIGGLILIEHVPNDDRMRLADSPYMTAAEAIEAIVVLLLVAIVAIRPRPFLSLSPAGITAQRWARRTTIGWDQLVPGGPPPPTTRSPKVLTIYTWTASTAGPFTPHHLPVHIWHVDPAFLAHTIRTYAERSRARAAIGTVAELARLQAAFASDAAPPATHRG